MKSVYCAVWTGSLNKAVCAPSLKVNHSLRFVITSVYDLRYSVSMWIFALKYRNSALKGPFSSIKVRYLVSSFGISLRCVLSRFLTYPWAFNIYIYSCSHYLWCNWIENILWRRNLITDDSLLSFQSTLHYLDLFTVDFLNVIHPFYLDLQVTSFSEVTWSKILHTAVLYPRIPSIFLSTPFWVAAIEVCFSASVVSARNRYSRNLFLYLRY